jgi:DNA segregation ATPase FtsK/SpoIIIE, S-DNA-T family
VVAFVRLETDPDPVRVRAAWVSDEDIRTMAASCAADPEPVNAGVLSIEAGAAA